MKFNLIILTALFFLGNWLLDVGHVVYFIGRPNAVLTNGFWNFSALQTYHAGWYLSIACFLIVIYIAFKESEKNDFMKVKLSKKEKNIYAKGLEDDFAGNEKEWWKIHHKILKAKKNE